MPQGLQGFQKGHGLLGTKESNIKRSKTAKNNGVGKWMLGRKLPNEVKLKIKLANTGKNNHFYGKKHTQETREKISKSRTGKLSGKNHWHWIEDRSKVVPTRGKDNKQYRDWSFNVKKRDVFKCRMDDENCSGRLESHHILSWRDHPELRYEIKNGITLCQFHHPHKKSEEERLSPYFTSLINNLTIKKWKTHTGMRTVSQL